MCVSQNHVRTQARGAERPLRGREEHPAQEADEGARGSLWIQRLTYVFLRSINTLRRKQEVGHESAWPKIMVYFHSGQQTLQIRSVNPLTRSLKCVCPSSISSIFISFSLHRHNKEPSARRGRWQRYRLQTLLSSGCLAASHRLMQRFTLDLDLTCRTCLFYTSWVFVLPRSPFIPLLAGPDHSSSYSQVNCTNGFVPLYSCPHIKGINSFFSP